MNDDPATDPLDDLDPELDDLLDRAAGSLREHTDSGWVRARGTLLARARAAMRPSAPVRGRHALGDFFVATVVLSAAVRHAVDSGTRARLHRITFQTDDEHALTEVTVHVGASFGEPLLTLAADVRAVVAARLRADLGTPELPDEVVRVDLVVVDVYDS